MDGYGYSSTSKPRFVAGWPLPYSLVAACGYIFCRESIFLKVLVVSWAILLQAHAPKSVTSSVLLIRLLLCTAHAGCGMAGQAHSHINCSVG